MLAPVIGEERTNRLWRAYLISDVKERRDLECMFEAYAALALSDVPSGGAVGLFPPPPPERALGDIDLGYVRYAGKDSFLFGLRDEELIRHVGIYGSSGCGKSNGIALILDGLMKASIPFLLCDFKRTFRGLLQDYKSRVLVFTVGDSRTSPFKMNPLTPPPGTSAEVWAKKVIGALSHAFCQGAGSESLLVTALDDAYRKTAAENRWPTFRDVAQLLEEQPARGRKGMWMDSAQRAVTSVSNGNAADVFCPEHSTAFTDLLTESVVLELDLLNQAEQTFLSEVILLWIIQYRMNNNVDRETLKHAIVIEEAHHLLSAPPGVGDGSEPVIHVALREVRELGESVILATQNASIVPVAVFGNQATTLAFHTKHQRDVSSTAQAMLLKDEAKDELGRLPVGEAIVRVPRWPDPVHIRLKHRPIAKGKVTDEDIRRHMAKTTYFTDTTRFQAAGAEGRLLGGIPHAEENQINPERSPSTQTHPLTPERISPATTPDKKRQLMERITEPTPLEVELLGDILYLPFQGVVQRVQRLRVSRRKGAAALRALEERGEIVPVTVFTGTSTMKLFDLTPSGTALCRSHGLGPLLQPTHGGIEHRYWVDRTAQRLESEAWEVRKEFRVADDLTVDVHATLNGRMLAVLVETGKSDARKNLEKTLAAGYEHIWVVTNSPKVMALGKSLPALAVTRVSFMSTAEIT
jgi:hypothetical protein